MPLSEDEQRILRDIERNFYENDPEFVGAVSDEALFRHAKRRIRLGVLGFVLSAVFLVVTFRIHPLIGLVGFSGMVACAFVVVQNVKNLGSIGIKDAAESIRSRQADRDQP